MARKKLRSSPVPPPSPSGRIKELEAPRFARAPKKSHLDYKHKQLTIHPPTSQCKFLLFFLKFAVAKARTSIDAVKKYLHKAYMQPKKAAWSTVGLEPLKIGIFRCCIYCFSH